LAVDGHKLAFSTMADILSHGQCRIVYVSSLTGFVLPNRHDAVALPSTTKGYDMSTTLRRGALPAAAVLLALALALAALALRPRSAGAQTVTGDVILSASVVVDPDVNGYAVLQGGTDIGLLAVVCSGSNPQGGTNQIPTQVMCQLRSTSVLIRVKNHVGTSVTAPVRIVLFGDFGAETPPPPAQTAFQHPRQVG
jgi:hypothetical protein